MNALLTCSVTAVAIAAAQTAAEIAKLEKSQAAQPKLSGEAVVAIDQYADAATGNRYFFLNKPRGDASLR
jgi:hypothetical protein